MFSKSKSSVKSDIISNSILSADTTIEGSMRTASSIRVEGTVLGNVNTEAKVIVGEVATVKGNINAFQAEILGKVEGDLSVNEVLTLRSTAVVSGDIVAKKMIFEAGAQFSGKCNVGEAVKQEL